MGSKKRISTAQPVVGKLHYAGEGGGRFRRVLANRNGGAAAAPDNRTLGGPNRDRRTLVAPKKPKPRRNPVHTFGKSKNGMEAGRIARNVFLRGLARDREQFAADLALYNKTVKSTAANVDTAKSNRAAQQGAGRTRPRTGLSRKGERTGGRSGLNIRG